MILNVCELSKASGLRVGIHKPSYGDLTIIFRVGAL